MDYGNATLNYLTFVVARIFNAALVLNMLFIF